MIQHPYIADARSVADAHELLTLFGRGAGDEAAFRAGLSRERGNARRFCHWRQVERLVRLLSTGRADATLH